MRALGVSLIVLGLLHVISGRATGRREALVGSAVAAAVSVPLALLAGCTPLGAAAIALSVALEAPLWLAAGSPSPQDPGAPRRAKLLLGGLLIALMLRIGTAGLWAVGPEPFLDRWVTHAPFPVLAGEDPSHVAYVSGAVFFLATGGNTFVRLLLGSIGSLSPSDRRTPGGGRVIGSIERVLIFSLAVAGESTAAALIISAKGILRFAEVRSTDPGDIDRVTEYVLVGSLASYTLALAFVVLA